MKWKNKASLRTFISLFGVRKINWISGLKGLCALFVFIHHFYLGYYPYFDIGGLDTPMINFIFNGNYMVCLFIAISSYLTCYLFEIRDNQQLRVVMVLKRYFRIMIPVAPIVVLYYLFYTQLDHRLLDGKYPITFGVCIRNIFLSPLGYNSLVGVLWMMKYIFWGTFISVAISWMLMYVNHVGKIIVLGLMTFLFYNTDIFYLPVIGGILTYMISTSNIIEHENVLWKIVGVVLVIFSLFILQYSGNLREPDYMINVGMSVITLIGLSISSWLQSLLSNYVLIWLGKISMGIFLIHNLVIDYLSRPLFSFLYENEIYGYLYLTIIMSLFVIIIFSSIYNRLVEIPSEKVIKKFMHFCLIK